jgi:hypothetical protein
MARRWVPGIGNTPWSVPRRNDYAITPKTSYDPTGPQSGGVTTSPDAPPVSQDPATRVNDYLKSALSRPVSALPEYKNAFGQTINPRGISTNLPHVPQLQYSTPDADVYWNNPGRLHRYKAAIDAAPGGWAAPSFLNPDAVNTAYEAMAAANGYKDWTQWKPVDTTSPLFEHLSAMPLPTREYMQPGEDKYFTTDAGNQLPEPVRWEDLPMWQKWLAHMTPAQEGFETATGAIGTQTSKGTSALVQGAISGMGGMGAATLVIGGLSLLGIGVPAAGAIAVGTGIAVGAAGAYQSLTKDEIPIMNQVLQTFDILSLAMERGIGTGQLMADKGVMPLMQDIDSIKAAVHTSGAAYETWKSEIYNVAARVMDFADFNSDYFEVDTANLAGPGESWAFEYGYDKPIESGAPEGAAGRDQLFQEVQQMQAQGASWQDIENHVEMFKQNYYSSGAANDMFFGSILDPANIVPFFGSKVLEGSSRKASPQFADYVATRRGSLFIDTLPMGAKQLAQFVSNTLGLGLKETPGIISTLQGYKIDARYKVNLGDAPTRAADYSRRVKIALDLDEQGRFKELQPAPPKRTGVIGRTMDWLGYLTGLTEDSKAHVILNMTHDTFSGILLDPDMNAAQKIEMLQKASGMRPVDMEKVGERYLQSSAVVTVSEGLKYALEAGAMDTYHAFTEAQRNFIPFMEATAERLNMPKEDLMKMVQDPTAHKRLMNLLKKAGIPEPDAKQQLKFLKDNLMGKNAVPLDEQQMWAEFSNQLYDKMGEYVTSTYNLGPENHIFRTASILKSVQSWFLLGYSPQFVYENFMGNKVAMALTGVVGAMPMRKARALMERFNIDPAKIGEGFAPDGTTATAFNLGGTQTKDMLHGAKRDLYRQRQGIDVEGSDGKARTDLLGKASQAVNSVTRMGVATKLSARIEAADAVQAFTAGMLQYYGGAWQVDRGLRRAPLEQAWESKYPGITEHLYRVIAECKNMPEVREALFSEVVTPTAGEVIDYAAKTMGRDPAEVRSAFDENGLTEDIREGLKHVETVQDIDNVFNGITMSLDQHIAGCFHSWYEGLARDYTG